MLRAEEAHSPHDGCYPKYSHECVCLHTICFPPHVYLSTLLLFFSMGTVNCQIRIRDYAYALSHRNSHDSRHETQTTQTHTFISTCVREAVVFVLRHNRLAGIGEHRIAGVIGHWLDRVYASSSYFGCLRRGRRCIAARVYMPCALINLRANERNVFFCFVCSSIEPTLAVPALNCEHATRIRLDSRISI